jgi:hypothetical protein
MSEAQGDDARVQRMLAAVDANRPAWEIEEEEKHKQQLESGAAGAVVEQAEEDDEWDDQEDEGLMAGRRDGPAVLQTNIPGLKRPHRFRDSGYTLALVGYLVFTTIMASIYSYEKQEHWIKLTAVTYCSGMLKDAAIFSVVAAFLWLAWLLAFYVQSARILFVMASYTLATVTSTCLVLFLLFHPGAYHRTLAGVLGVFLFQDVVFMLRARNRFQFGGVMVELVSEVVQYYGHVLFVAVACLAAHYTFTVWWSGLFCTLLANGAPHMGGVVLLLLLFAYYWWVGSECSQCSTVG